MYADLFNTWSWEDAGRRIYSCDADDVERALSAPVRTAADLFPFFSPAADPMLERMARTAAEITHRRFGNVIQLYTPLYISNECTNACSYCGFSAKNEIKRVTLTPDEVAAEADYIYRSGFRHLLLLTGEHPKAVPVAALADIVRSMHRRFASVSIEVYPMSEAEYALLAEAGVDGLTVYQETYNREVYEQVHPRGRKRDFDARLGAPDRGGRAGIRKVGVGALLGLADWRIDGFFTALHALSLTRDYWKTQVQVSFPRLRQAPGGFIPPSPVDDRALVRLICAMRIILPDAGLLLSTREAPAFRDHAVRLGITMMSAGSKTSPGGYLHVEDADEQFAIVDDRTPQEIVAMLKRNGFDPVWKDWDRDIIG